MNCLFVVAVSVLLCNVGAKSIGPCAQALKNTANKPSNVGAYKPQCTKDGNYELIQRHGSTGYSWCANPVTGVKVQGTEVAPGKTPKCSACLTKMARALNGGIWTEGLPPQCDAAGNFERRHVNFFNGMVWCVDPKTGEMIGEIEYPKLGEKIASKSC